VVGEAVVLVTIVGRAVVVVGEELIGDAVVVVGVTVVGWGVGVGAALGTSVTFLTLLAWISVTNISELS
jgi:hypothetical protein